MLSQTLITYNSLFLRNVDKKDIRIFLESSPLYPNLLSVLRTLKYVGLNTRAGQCNWDHLSNLKSPFLLHIKFKSKENLVISRWNQDRNVLEILHPAKNGWEAKNKEDIVNAWDGVVIYTDAIPIRNMHVKKYTTIAVALVIFVLIIYLIFKEYGGQAICTFPIFVGLVISVCMYWQNYISPINILDKFCH